MRDDLKLDVPCGWELASLNTATELNPRLEAVTHADNPSVSFVPMPAVEAGTGIVDVSRTRHLEEVKKGYTHFKKNDVIFAKITPCMENGKMAVVPSLENDLGFGSTEFHVLRPHSGISPQYIYYFISSEVFRSEAQHNMTGAVGQRRVPASYLEEQTVPIPPAREQHRIVAKIKELFSELDKGVESLKTARAKLNVYRQAVLKHAFEGKLTAKWREENKDKLEKPEKLLARIKQERAVRYQRQLREWETAVKKWEQNGKEGKKPVKPRKLSAKYGQRVELADSSERDIPHGWYETIFGEVIRNISINHKKLPKTQYSETGTFPVIDQGQKIVDGYCNELDRVVDEDLPLIVFGDHTRILKFINRPFVPGADGVKVFKGLGVDDKWLFYIAHALDFPDKGYARHFQHLKKARLLVPSLTEQRCIVAEVEEKLSVLEDLKNTLDQQLIMANAFRQSVLKKAFAGQLVSQDTSDEPASILLARIRIEREKAMQFNYSKKTKKRKTAV